MSPNQTFTVGTIGAGNVAQTIARLVLAAGHNVILSNSRGPESLTELVSELGANARLRARLPRRQGRIS